MQFGNLGIHAVTMRMLGYIDVGNNTRHMTKTLVNSFRLAVLD